MFVIWYYHVKKDGDFKYSIMVKEESISKKKNGRSIKEKKFQNVNIVSKRRCFTILYNTIHHYHLSKNYKTKKNQKHKKYRDPQ